MYESNVDISVMALWKLVIMSVMQLFIGLGLSKPHIPACLYVYLSVCMYVCLCVFSSRPKMVLMPDPVLKKSLSL